THGEDGFPTNNPAIAEKQLKRLNEKISANRDDLVKVEKLHLDDAEVVVVAYGATARSARKAVNDARAQGIKAGMLRPITIWPFAENEMLEVKAKSPKAVIVAEM